jgi:hypothetical protein
MTKTLIKKKMLKNKKRKTKSIAGDHPLQPLISTVFTIPPSD